MDARAVVATTDDDVWFGIEVFVFGLRREHMVLRAKPYERTMSHTLAVVNAVCADLQNHPTSPAEIMSWPEVVELAPRLASLADFSTTTQEPNEIGHVRSAVHCADCAGYLALVDQAQALGIPVLLLNKVVVQLHANPTFSEQAKGDE